MSIPDLTGKTLAVMRGSIHTEGPDGIRSLLKQFNVSCEFREVNSYNDVFELIDQDQVDAGVVNRIFGNKHEDQFHAGRTYKGFAFLSIH